MPALLVSSEHLWTPNCPIVVSAGQKKWVGMGREQQVGLPWSKAEMGHVAEDKYLEESQPQPDFCCQRASADSVTMMGPCTCPQYMASGRGAQQGLEFGLKSMGKGNIRKHLSPREGPTPRQSQ